MTNSNIITAALIAVDNLQETSVGLSARPAVEANVMSSEAILFKAECDHLRNENQKLRAMVIKKTEEIIDLKFRMEKEKEKQEFRNRMMRY